MYWPHPHEMFAQPNGMFTEPMAQTSSKATRIFSEDLKERNIGKKVTAYMTYDGSAQWRDKIFVGKLKAVGRDFFVLTQESNSKDVTLYNINEAWLEWDEPVTL